MTSTRPQTRPTSFNLGQLMLAVGTSGALFALVSTVKTLKGSGDLYLIVGCILSYSFYLGLLLLISAPYFTRNQLLILLASTAALASLLIQAIAVGSGWVTLAAILFLPAMPFVLGAAMLRYSATYEPEEGLAGDSETLATLVRNKRERGLTPQAGPLDDAEPEGEARGMGWRRAIALVAIIALAIAAIGLLRRRAAYLELAATHAREEQKYAELVLELEQKIESEESPEGDPKSESARESITRMKREVQLLNRKADWHARRREAYEGRWW